MTEGNCLLWGICVIILEKLQGDILCELHQNHTGISHMKANSCISCQAVKEAPPIAPLHPWIWPTKPWERIHVDFAGSFLNKMFLIVVDAHSKWPEVIQMTFTSADK